MIFYTADLHFGHEKVLEMSNRPFGSIEEHDNYIISKWNETVSDNDDVYILGDIAYRNKIPTEIYLSKLRGRLHLIIGNHDLKYLSKISGADEHFASINQMIMVKDNVSHVVLCHYPLAEWSGYFRGWYHLHGHIHNNRESQVFQYLRTQERALNAGVDLNHFKPVTLEELIENNRKFKEEE